MTTFSFILPTIPPDAPLELTEETNYVNRARYYTLWQYHDKPQFQALLAAFIDALQPLEALAFDVYTNIRLDTAVGVQLDLLGRIVGPERGTKTDDAYRTFMQGKILANKSDCTIPEIYEILELFEFDTKKIIEYFPASYIVEVTAVDYPLEIFQLLSVCKPGGVGMHFVYSTYDEDETYQMSESYPGEQTDSNRGAGSVYDSGVGGRVAGIFS